jgi:hypothetical protein
MVLPWDARSVNIPREDQGTGRNQDSQSPKRNSRNMKSEIVKIAEKIFQSVCEFLRNAIEYIGQVSVEMVKV